MKAKEELVTTRDQFQLIFNATFLSGTLNLLKIQKVDFNIAKIGRVRA